MAAQRKTIYLNNLNERVGAARLRIELHRLSEKIGPVASVTTRRGIRKRGQAFVAFVHAADAEKAIEVFNNQKLYAKTVNASYARAETGEVKGPVKSALSQQSSSESSENPTDSQSQKRRAPDSAAPVKKPKKDLGEPHNLLLLQQIPEEITVEDLKSIGASHPGFVNARMFAARHVGFLEFASTDEASAAINELSTKSVGNITYAKK